MFAAAALYPGVLGAFVQEDALFIVMHRAAGAEWSGLTPAEVRRADGATILLRRPPGREAYARLGEEVPLQAAEQVLAVVARRLLSAPALRP